MPVMMPTPALETSSNVSVRVPPFTAPLTTAPGTSWNTLPLTLPNWTAAAAPEMEPLLVTVPPAFR